VTGIEPYVLVLDPTHKPDALVLDSEALGDAAALLAHRRSWYNLILSKRSNIVKRNLI
jgi:hypothetical protein